MNTETPRTNEIARGNHVVPTEWAEELERENAKLHDEFDRLLQIETAARQWWQAKGRYNSQIAACKLGEALGYPVTWPDAGATTKGSIESEN